MRPRPGVVWMQLGIRNDEAAALAEENGIKVVMNRCPKIEYGRLSVGDFVDGREFAHLSSRRAQTIGPRAAHGAQPRRSDRIDGARGGRDEAGDGGT